MHAASCCSKIVNFAVPLAGFIACQDYISHPAIFVDAQRLKDSITTILTNNIKHSH